MTLNRMLRKIFRVAISGPACTVWVASLACMIVGSNDLFAEAELSLNVAATVTLTNTLQLRQLASAEESLNCFVQIEGIVLWVSPARDRLILQDDFGGVTFQINLRNDTVPKSGQKIRIEGNGQGVHGEIDFIAVVDNDGTHSVIEKSGSVFLSAGPHPICVECYNARGPFVLALEWMGPETSRERISDAALFRAERGELGETSRLTHGLDYRYYEGTWDHLPDFSQLPVLKSGVVTNFQLGVRNRDTNVALVFNGYLEVLRPGQYEFWTTSDDGSKLYLDLLPRLSILGNGSLPQPQRIFPGQIISEAQEGRWAEVEGTVSSVVEQPGEVSIELTSGSGHACLKVKEERLDSLGLLLHSRVKAAGICQTTFAVDGQTIPSLLVPGLKEICIVEMASANWADYPLIPIGILVKTNSLDSTGTIVHVSGTVCSNSQEKVLLVEDETGRVSVQTAQAFPEPGDQIEILGRRTREGNDMVLRDGFYRKAFRQVNHDSQILPLLTQAIQVMSLSRLEAGRGYPVKIRGVITARVGQDCFMQDATWSVYVAWNGLPARETPKIGDFWEIEGASSVHFAPDVQARRAVYLGPGNLPEPIRPTWDELISGSLATKYIEIQGVATASETNTLTLLTRAGKVRLLLNDLRPNELTKLENSLVRVRGVSSPDRDVNQMILPRLRLFNASVNVDEPAPAHPFETPLKRVSDLFFFDARADAFRRVRIAGQVVHERQGEYFLMDGTNGFRFKPKSPLKLSVGDLVEAVGFLNMEGPSPVLHEAVVRPMGKSDLPAARHLSEDEMLSGKLDATLVRAESRLVSLNVDRSEQVMELQAGNRNYVARLANQRGLLSGLLPGSLLELTGVYAGQGGDRASSRDIDSFELLLNSPANIRVLARPSWWTFRHALTVIGGMLFVIIVGLVWINLLRRQVEERSLQLTAEIKSRERAEHQRAIEAERARIAQDLHDDLGATLTEIRFLSAVESRDSSVPEATRSQLMEVSEKSRQMVSSLDEIVWAVNPANDSLPSLANYLCHVTGEFFRATEVRCRLDVDESLPSVTLTSEVRHNLYLVVREALNNIAKHSQATEAWLRIHWKNQILQIVIEDNGQGFAEPNGGATGDGLHNMRRRLEKIGGRFECDTRLGIGTVCRIDLLFT